MAEIKTKRTKASVAAFIRSVADTQQRADAKQLLTVFADATGMKPAMWGNGMIGFGTYHYKSERSSQEGDWPLTAFAPRKGNLTLYIMSGTAGDPALLKRLGKHTTSGGSCLYVKRLSDIHIPTLRTIIRRSVREMRRRYAVTTG